MFYLDLVYSIRFPSSFLLWFSSSFWSQFNAHYRAFFIDAQLLYFSHNELSFLWFRVHIFNSCSTSSTSILAVVVKRSCPNTSSLPSAVTIDRPKNSGTQRMSDLNGTVIDTIPRTKSCNVISFVFIFFSEVMTGRIRAHRFLHIGWDSDLEALLFLLFPRRRFIMLQAMLMVLFFTAIFSTIYKDHFRRYHLLGLNKQFKNLQFPFSSI